MGTQIFIKPDGCKVEYTKIATHSLGFVPQAITDPVKDLFVGGASLINSSLFAWSGVDYNFRKLYTAGIIRPVKNQEQGIGIPLPINLVEGDTVTLNGTAYFNQASRYESGGYNVKFIYGVYYFNCEELSKPEGAPAYTFIPIDIVDFGEGNIACFSTSITLGSNYDAHQTRFVLGFNVYAECPEGDICIPPDPNPELTTVSYTLDIERPCAVNTAESNFIIRNCCEPVITELVNIPGLQVDSFHVDDEGNCWEVMEASNDVTNFTRNFVNNYTSCVECQSANECPNNLIISSCCIQGQEFVSGSLPGLNVGDTFVDNNGLCWFVSEETGAPVSEESITVVSITTGDCAECRDANPCPDLWVIESCCGSLIETIATTNTTMNIGDSFVDTDGTCWTIKEEADTLPTNYNIVVDTVYPSPDACATCIGANPCPPEYFLTLRMCCDPDRVEVTAVPLSDMVFTEGVIFADPYKVCWEVMSYSTTGVETYPIDWTTPDAVYPECQRCILERECIQYYEVKDCNTEIIYTARANATLIVGSFYSGMFDFLPLPKSCFEVLGYGYPQGGVDITIDPVSFGSCIECFG
jgi:hypothetical protein